MAGKKGRSGGSRISSRIGEPVEPGNPDGEWRNRPQNADEIRRSQENLIGLWDAEFDRHTPANGGRS